MSNDLPITEKDLSADFEKYQKLLEELYLQYGLNYPTDPIQTFDEPTYVSEAVFSYEVHAS